MKFRFPAPKKPDYNIDNGSEEMPETERKDSRPESLFLKTLRKTMTANARIKPTFADSWILGSADNLEVIETYQTPYGKVTIGTTPSGEMEYNLSPTEYVCSDSINGMASEIIERIRDDYRKNGGRSDRFYIDSKVTDILSEYSDELALLSGGDSTETDRIIRQICDIVFRYTVGLGVFDILLADPRLEDIYIDAPCDRNRIHVTLSGLMGSNAHERCRTNIMVEKREVMNLICCLKRISGLPYNETSPVLETDKRI